MAWFGRGAKGGAPDAHLPMFTVQQATRFRAAAQRAFAEAGMETVLAEGVLLTMEGAVAHLDQVAAIAVEVPERAWPQLLARHAGVLAQALTQGPLDPATMSDRLYLRVLGRDALPGPFEVGDEVVGDLVAVVGVDHPNHVDTLTRAETVEELGGWPWVRETGLRNLRALAAEDTHEYPLQGGGTIHVSTGGYFHASRLLVLGHVLAGDFRIERPAHGLLVAVPNRDMIVVHPVEGVSAISAMSAMIGMAADQYERPGGLTREVFFWRDGAIEQVTRRDENGGAAVDATGLFGQALAELGLIDGA